MFELIIVALALIFAVSSTFAIGVAFGRRAVYKQVFTDRRHGQWMLEKLAQHHHAKVQMVNFPGAPS